MRAFAWNPATETPEGLAGAVVCQDVAIDGYRLHKGHRLCAEELPLLTRLPKPLHLALLAADDVHEDQAGPRLAAALTAPELALTPPRQSRVNAVVAGKGLLRIDVARLHAANRLPGVSIFTLPDRMPVLPGRVVAGIKITPVAVPEATIAAVEAIGAGDPVIRLLPFRPLAVGVVTAEGMAGRARDRFQAAVRAKIGWYGGRVLGFEDLPGDSAALAAAIARFAEAGAGLILTGGGSAIDPLDATLQALPMIGAELIVYGAPIHPGSMFWLAERGGLPILNLASCSMYSRATSVDLILPAIMAGEQVTADDVAALGAGGLVEGKEFAARFPLYDREAATPDEGT